MTRPKRLLTRAELQANVTLREQLREIAKPKERVQELELNLGFGTVGGMDLGHAELQLVIRQIAAEVEAETDRIEQLAIGLHVLVAALQEQNYHQTGTAHTTLNEHATAENIRREWEILGREVRRLELSSKLVTRLIEGVTKYSAMSSPLPAATIAGYALELTGEKMTSFPPHKDRPFGRRYTRAPFFREVIK